MQAESVPLPATLGRRLLAAAKPHVLYPVVAVTILAVIWGMTLNLIRVERHAAERATAVSAQELAETHEARVVRTLREIDQTLKVVKYAYELRGRPEVLNELKVQSLLPAELLFTVSIVDLNGNLMASTRPFADASAADQVFIQDLPQTDGLSVGRSRRAPGSGQWNLQFSRDLNGAGGSRAGIVTVSVDAAHFVSGYEASKLGAHGVLGLLGIDGVVRVRRSGEVITAGDRDDFASLLFASDQAEKEAQLVTSASDGVQRYIGARRLYGFPLIAFAGLSAGEQLAETSRDMRAYLWRAGGGSLLLLLILVVMGRQRRQLELSRLRAVEEQLAHAARIEYLAYHDGLTDLPNRSLFSRLVNQGILMARRDHRHLGVLFLDLDRFKRVNDTLGHDAGDQLLKEVARRLKTCLRESDTVARVGGDEFVALLPDLREEQYAAAVAQKILSAVALPFKLLGEDYRITASVGISLYPQDGEDEQTLAKNADVAMYQAKEEGKNRFRFYSEALNSNSLERLALESNLRLALEKNEFELLYHPKRRISSERISGLEALLRWRHPDLGTVAPLQFIPVAEETGLIVPIGKWVIRTACLQNVAWQREGLPRVVVTVNMTARQFADERLLPDLAAILAETGMDARLLELEFSENLLMREVDKTLRIFTGLRELGIRIAIDDFGIGYAALATIRRFPLDTIKIDRSLIRDVISVDQDRILAEAIIAMGKVLSVTVVAQGVETKAQAEFLRANDCDEFQGFYLNRPESAGRIAALLRAQPE